VIELYHQHGTSEQFHSEIKTDMDMERLPAGSSPTNALVLSLGLVAYNVLRLCGQTALKQNERLAARGKDADSQAGWASPAAERDAGLDVLGDAADASRPSGLAFRFGGTIPGMGCGGSFMRNSAVGVARPRSNGGEDDEWISTRSDRAGGIPRDERELGRRFSEIPHSRPRRNGCRPFQHHHFSIEAAAAYPYRFPTPCSRIHVVVRAGRINNCHPERQRRISVRSGQILRCAQDDS